MVNMRLKGHILEAVDNQLKADDPKCVKVTLERLIVMGYTEKKAKEMIGAVLIEEMYRILKEEQQFNEELYCKKLSMLPNNNSCVSEEELDENFTDTLPKVPIKNENKIGRNDLCTCGSGKKYKKCCGR
jgi:uncharacterized protein YecA (UPF0149 family)